MIRQTPNKFQKLLHNVFMMRTVSAILAVILHRLDILVLKFSKGRYTVAQLSGLPVIQITTLGAKTGRSHSMPLVGVFDENKIALIGSNFGKKSNPGWYYNLKANPHCKVLKNGVEEHYVAREAFDAEREIFWDMAVSIYAGYELYRIRATHRIIPIILLEPLSDCQD